MKKILLALALFLTAPLAALSAGYFQYPSVVLPFTGIETVPMDTNLAGGSPPQTVIATLPQLKSYVLGNAAVDTGTTTAVGTGPGTATLNTGRGIVTTPALTTAAAASYVLTLTNSAITANSIVLVTVGMGTATTGAPTVAAVTPAAGSAVINIQNIASAAALNGTISIRYVVIN